MSLLADYGLETASRRIILLVLSIEDGNGEKGVDLIHMNKIIKYYEHLINRIEIDFSNFNLGAVSYEIQESIDFLEEIDLIEESYNKKYYLTKDGELSVRELRNKIINDEFDKLKIAKKLLNDLSYDELLYFMYKLFPDTKNNSSQLNKLNRISRRVIHNLLEKKKINQEQADEWLLNPL